MPVGGRVSPAPQDKTQVIDIGTVVLNPGRNVKVEFIGQITEQDIVYKGKKKKKPGSRIITLDTVVENNDRLPEKPAQLEEAKPEEKQPEEKTEESSDDKDAPADKPEEQKEDSTEDGSEK